MTEQPHATSQGQTGGLPGANAHPDTTKLSDDQIADTVATGDVAAPDSPRTD